MLLAVLLYVLFFIPLFLCAMCRTIIEFEHVSAIGVDLVRGFKTLDLIKKIGLPAGKTLFAGVVDGRNIWANDLAVSVAILEDLEKTLGKGSFSLLAANSGFRHKSSTGEFDSLHHAPLCILLWT